MDDILKKCTNIIHIKDGGQKKVYKCQHENYGSVVIKIGSYLNETSLERIKREVNFLKEIDSIYYPKNFDFFLDLKNNQFYIIEEFIDSLSQEEVKAYLNNESNIISFLKKLLEGLIILWKKNIVHRDIKPDNILMKKDKSPLIIDLGIARFLDFDSLTKSIFPMGPCTRIYASPEQLQNKKNIIDMRSDFFAIGIIILEFYLGFHPFLPDRVGNNKSILENIINCIYVHPDFKKETTKEFTGLINKLLQPYPHQRFRDYNILLNYININWRDI